MSEYDVEDVEYNEDLEGRPEDAEEFDEALLEKVETLRRGGAYWAEDILDIENEQLREEAIESTERFVEKSSSLRERISNTSCLRIRTWLSKG